ncbi:hypothetical protein PR202_gb02669 [Eleusine coracana subsp. coracana]|uniref:AP2/ERF domain-containing protein n=1 Tax=Eleusine coracana subsp. coracana TaxID=191504 RepID=A0AAV5DZM5_ELECO|nr:hypothetical protein PR202_gb02669 [Eleusine coracana subsp. coracana]
MAAIGSAAAARRRGGGGARGATTTPGARKNLGFVGARCRPWGRWSAELRVPRSRDRLWIGTFATPKEAAHAYDAATYCFYGARIPRIRKINFPTAPRPDIPEHVRVALTVENIRAIAEKYALSLADYMPPPPPPELPAAADPAPPEVLVTEEAPPVDAAASVGVGAAPTTNSGNVSDFGEDIDFADCLLSLDLADEVDEFMGFPTND